MKKEERFINGSTFIVDGTVKWAAVHEPDTKYEPCWKVDLYPSDPEMIKEMKDAGFNMKQDKEGDTFIRVKSKVTTKGGKKNMPPSVTGRDPKVPFTDAIGNGSECKVMIYAKYMDVAGVTYLPAYLNGVQVMEHVSYDGGGASFQDETTPF